MAMGDEVSGRNRIPPSQSQPETALIAELAEAHTALGLRLVAMKLTIEGPGPAQLIKTIDECIAQSERADKALRRLRHLLNRRAKQYPLQLPGAGKSGQVIS